MNEIVKREALTPYQLEKISLYDNMAIVLMPHEDRTYQAMLSTKMRDYDKRKLFENIGNLFENIARDAGIPFTMDPMVITRITDILLAYYSHLTINEVKMAFELAMVGKLDNYLPKRGGSPDISHYQKLTIDWISRIINAYAKYKNSLLEKVVENQKPDYDGIHSDFRGLMIERFEIYKKTKKLPSMVYTSAIQFLAKYGLETEEEKGMSVREIMEHYHLAICKFFDDMIEQNKSMEDLINGDQ